MLKKILILNGSPQRDSGNSGELISLLETKIVKAGHAIKIIHLKDFLDKKISFGEIQPELESASGYIFTTGTYWDSWGSPLQYFLEQSTFLEGENTFLAKPAAVVVSMHSVGGKSILSRLQGVLNTLGFSIPPMSGFVYSLTAQLALEKETRFSDDFWSLEDLDIVLHNLLVATGVTGKYQAWPVDKKDPRVKWINQDV